MKTSGGSCAGVYAAQPRRSTCLNCNACLTPAGRRLLCQRIAQGAPIAHVAAGMGISRQCASRWWNRWREFGPAGLEDRSSAPIRRTRIAAKVEDRIVYLRRSRRWGPDLIAAYMRQSSSTVHRVLVRRGLNRLDRLDRQIRRYEHPHPGSLVHVDVKKRGPHPQSWRLAGPRPLRSGAGPGYWLRIHPRRRGRPQPLGLRGGTRRRARPLATTTLRGTTLLPDADSAVRVVVELAKEHGSGAHHHRGVSAVVART